jgi:hypothetical protein
MKKNSTRGSLGELIKSSGILSQLGSGSPPTPSETRNAAAPPQNDVGQTGKPKLKLSAAGQKRSEEDYAAIEKKRRVADEVAAVRRAAARIMKPTLKPKAPPAKTPSQQRRETAERVHSLISTATLTVEEKRPKELDSRVIKKVDDCIKRGAAKLASADRFDEGGAIMGVDFGTSSIKIVLRWPFVTGSPAIATSVPEEMRSGSLPHLWQTVVWVGADEKPSIYPKPDTRPMDGFKAKLINDAHGGCDPNGVSFDEAAIACLALHIAHAAGEEFAPLPELRSTGFSGIHMAVPVATTDDKPVMDRFEAIACRAVMLAGSAHELSLAMIRKAMREDIPADIKVNVRVYPELAAVVAGYAGSRERHMGPNVVIDCGAATLDIATFILRPGEGQAAFSTFEAKVATLGAEAWRWAKGAGITEDDFLLTCHDLHADVFVPTQDHRAPREFRTDAATNKKDVQLIAVGGGMNGKIYRTFTKPLAARYGRQELHLSAPEKLKCIEGTDYSRLLLADGLARQHFDIPEFRKPSEISDAHKKIIDYSGNYIDN